MATKKTTALAKPDLEILALPPGVALEPDNRDWTNRFTFVSDSGKEYRVAQHKEKRGWGCSCPSWKYKTGGTRNCKHLKAFGIPGDEKPFEIGELRTTALPSAAAPTLTAVTGGKTSKASKAIKPSKAPAALPAAPAALPHCAPKSVEMKNGDIVVTFDAKDSAAVFALLAQLSK